jgi:GTP cyclohydrolase I
MEFKEISTYIKDKTNLGSATIEIIKNYSISDECIDHLLDILGELKNYYLVPPEVIKTKLIPDLFNIAFVSEELSVQESITHRSPDELIKELEREIDENVRCN